MKSLKVIIVTILSLITLSALAATELSVHINTLGKEPVANTKLTFLIVATVKDHSGSLTNVTVQSPWVAEINSNSVVEFNLDSSFVEYIQANGMLNEIPGTGVKNFSLIPILFTDAGKAAIEGMNEPDNILDSDDMESNILMGANGGTNYLFDGVVQYFEGNVDAIEAAGFKAGFNIVKDNKTTTNKQLTVVYTGPDKNKLPTKHFIKVPAVAQGTYMCGAASIAMVFQYYNIDIDQYEVAEEMCDKGYNSSSACVFKNGEFQRIKYTSRYKIAPYFRKEYGEILGYSKAVQEKGAGSTTIVSDSIALLKKHIANDRPVVVRTCYSAGKNCVTHFRVVVGYDDDNQILYINEPLGGRAGLPVSYDTFFNKLWIVDNDSASKRSTRFMIYHNGQ